MREDGVDLIPSKRSRRGWATPRRPVGLPAPSIRYRPRATEDTCFSNRADRRRLGADAAPRH
jgi:hypothetical protein